jgi:hypothetical protein
MSQTIVAFGSPERTAKEEFELEERLKKVVEAGPIAIEERLNELDREWSVGRMTKVVLAGIIGLGLGLALAHDILWLIVAGIGALFLAQYMVAPRCMLGGIIRRFGFRPGTDIENEKLALRALRGDFQQLPTIHNVEDHEALSRLEGEGGIAMEPDESKRQLDEVVKEVLEVTHR